MDKQKTLDICDRLRGFSFYLLAAGVAFSNSFTEIATTAIIILWISDKILKKDYTFAGGKLTLILALFAIWNLASFINTSYVYESIRGLLKVIKHILLFLATIDYFRTKKNLEKFLLFVLGVGFIISLNGIVQYIIGTDLIRQRTIDTLDYLYRVSSSFRHANDFGAYLIVITTMLLSLFFSRARSLKERILLILVILPLIWCLAATSSRGAWLGFVIALLCLVIVKSKRLFALFLILLLVSPVFMPSSMKNRLSDLTKIGREGGTVWERVKLWSGTLAMVKEHPLLGFGVNTYTKNFPDYKPKDYPDIRYTHNSYLHMASEIGIIGAGIFLLFLVSLIVSAGKAVSIFEKGLGRDLFLGLLAGVVGFLIHCAVDTHIYSVTLSAFLFLCLGLAVAFRNVAYEEKT